MTDWTDPETFGRVLEHSETLETGHYAEFFDEGDVIEHDPGLVLSQWGNELWTSQTLNHDPTYWRSDRAADADFDDRPIHPDYLLAATLGITVEDLSEKGGYFLGRTNGRFHRDVYPGTELRVESEVLSVEASGSRPSYAIVTWRTTGLDAETGERLCSYDRTNMIPRREPARVTDGGGSAPTDQASGMEEAEEGDAEEVEAEDEEGKTKAEEKGEDIPSGPFVAPEGPHFEDFVAALETAADHDGVAAYRHERGRTIDDVTVATLPLSTLNTARQHHNVDAMADAPSGDIVAYGDVSRSIALGHARSDEATYRDLGFDDERFHTFVTPGDTIYGFTRVLEAVELSSTGGSTPKPLSDFDDEIPTDRAGLVRFQHIAFNQRDEPVYSGRRLAAIRTSP
ncbi:MaoC domain-containing protein dehydratase [Halovivax asiaticus JCM 14624]|uniref:MaoC domain-containing protein dehydratase n=1 Tax=Halovivax asiaticus JCM 14624 TaxID=1227490 RepID=M0BT34_9EURY|nr:2-methylfumaryl-CoA hydratase [Halovivax asiaticus]ELZ14100.1 MaoC domain-containing protein dehydratase [Halovivax asiaticus JCM 14624]